MSIVNINDIIKEAVGAKEYNEMCQHLETTRYDSGYGIPSSCGGRCYGTKWKTDLHYYTPRKDPREGKGCYYYYKRTLGKDKKSYNAPCDIVPCQRKNEAIDLARARSR